MSKYVLVSHDSENINFYNPHTYELLKKQKLPESFAYRPSWDHCKNCQVNEDEFAVGDNNKNVFLFSIASQKVIQLPSTHVPNYMIYCIDAKTIGRKNLMLSSSGNGEIVLWDVQKRELIKHMGDIHNSSADCVLFIDEKLFASGGSDSRLCLVDYTKLSKKKTPSVHVFKDHKNWVLDLCVHENKNILYTASQEGSSRIFDIRTKKATGKIVHEMVVKSVYKWNNYLFTGDQQGSLFSTDLRKIGKFVYEIRMHSEAVYRIIGNVIDENQILTCSLDEFIKIVNAKDGSIKAEIKERDRVHGIFFFKDTQKYLDLQERIVFLNEKILEIGNSFTIQFANTKLEVIKLFLL